MPSFIFLNPPNTNNVHYYVTNSTCPQIEMGADVNIASDNEKEDGKGTPLVLAARNNLHDVIPALLNKGADEWAKDSRNNMMALHYVAQSKSCK